MNKLAANSLFIKVGGKTGKDIIVGKKEKATAAKAAPKKTIPPTFEEKLTPEQVDRKLQNIRKRIKTIIVACIDFFTPIVVFFPCGDKALQSAFNAE